MPGPRTVQQSASESMAALRYRKAQGNRLQGKREPEVKSGRGKFEVEIKAARDLFVQCTAPNGGQL